MKKFNVHIYREMRLSFEGIDADTLEAAAYLARDKATCDADAIDDCEGETLSALVDVAGDVEYAESRFIDFDGEQVRKAAQKLLMAVRTAENYLADGLDEDDEMEMRIFTAICDARAEATAAGIRAESPAPLLLAALKAVLPYAESERASLHECWQRDDDLNVKAELDACDRALDQALDLIPETLRSDDRAQGSQP